MPKMKNLVGNSRPKRRILFLPLLGGSVHRYRQFHATLCMGSLCPTKVQTDVAESLVMGTGLLVIDTVRETPLCVGCGDLKSCGLGNVLVCGSAAEYVEKGLEWVLKCCKEAISFLREKDVKNSDYYDTKRVPSTIEKAVDLILHGKRSIDLSQEHEPSSMFVDRRGAGILHIYDQLSESLSKRPLPPRPPPRPPPREDDGVSGLHAPPGGRVGQATPRR
jgi:hypothetical protein